MKKILLPLVLCLISYCAFSQNLSWKPVNADLGKNIKTIIPDSLNRLIIQSEKGVFIFSDLKEIKRIDDLLPDSIKISCIAIDTGNSIYVGTYEDGVYRFDEIAEKWISPIPQSINFKIENIIVNLKNDIIFRTPTGFYYWISENDSLIDYKKPAAWNYEIVYPLRYDSSDNLYLGVGQILYRFNVDSNELKFIYYFNDEFNNKIDYNTRINDINTSGNKIFLATNSASILTSIDSGNTWTRLYDEMGYNLNIIKVLISPKDEIIAITHDNGVYYSNNNGATFEENNIGLPNFNLLYGELSKDGRVILSLKDNGLYFSESPKNTTLKPSRWKKIDQHYERIAHYGNIDEIKFIDQGRKIITRKKSLVRIWDTETGVLLDEYDYMTPKQLCSISSDDSSIVFLENISPSSLFYSLKASIYHLNTHKLIRTDLISHVEYCPYSNILSEDNKSDFNYKNNKLFVNYKFLVECGSWKKNVYYSGIIQAVLTDTLPILKEICSIPTNDWISSAKREMLLYLYDEHKWESKGKSEKNILGVKSVNNEEVNEFIISEVVNSIPDTFKKAIKIRYLKQKNWIAALFDDNKLLYWDINLKNGVDSSYFPYPPVDFLFSETENYIIAGINKGIYILNRQLTIVDSIPFHYQTGNAWKIAVSTDSVSLAVGSDDGILRLYKSTVLTNVEEDSPFKKSLNQELGLVVSPNPASDFIEISVGAQQAMTQQIKIYDVFGQEVNTYLDASDNPLTPFDKGEFSTPALRATPRGGELRIDVSHLSPGLYFVRVGEKVGKFIKI